MDEIENVDSLFSVDLGIDFLISTFDFKIPILEYSNHLSSLISQSLQPFPDFLNSH
jgi:hypothetical protein